MGEDVLKVNKEVKRLLTNGLKQHLEIDFPMLKKRVEQLEGKQDKVAEMQDKVYIMEDKVNDLSNKVDSLGNKVESFFLEMRNEFQKFTAESRNLNNSFIRWLIGTVLVSLILGLFCQYKAFQDVHSSIHSLDKKITIIQSVPRKAP